MAALLAKIDGPQIISVSKSAVQMSAGHLVTLCGRAKVVTMGGGAVATRFFAMERPRRAAMLEFEDPNFAVLWTRLCDGRDGGSW